MLSKTASSASLDGSAGNPLPQSTKPKVPNACEACRAAKLKCQPSSQQGICRRCLARKKECVYRTGPRTRRSRLSKSSQSSAPRPPPPGPSKTFSIDFPMPAQDDDAISSFSYLRSQHEKYFNDLMSTSPPDIPWHGHGGMPTPASSTTSAIAPTDGCDLKPQFNLDNAEKLLTDFRTTLPFFPIITLEPDATVSNLSKTSPFILLAILATSSRSKTVQGQNLYDEEFRKILALKYVAGGERSLELLQGLLIYCAWYPFHLRPKNKQAHRYVRMAVDLVQDLELETFDNDVPEYLTSMRTYLGTYYLVSSFNSSWCKPTIMRFTDHAQSCCDLLERLGSSIGDRVLAWMVRMQHLIEQVGELRTATMSPVKTQYQAKAVLLGIEAQLKGRLANLPPELSKEAPVVVINTFAQIFLNSAPLVRLPLPRTPRRDISTNNFSSIFWNNVSEPDPTLKPEVDRLKLCIPLLRQHLGQLVSLTQIPTGILSSIDWGRFILSIILAFRLSFPIAGLPDWDSAFARERLEFLQYIDRFCAGNDSASVGTASRGEASGTAEPSLQSGAALHILSASKVVMEVVKEKYIRQLEHAAREEAHRQIRQDIEGRVDMNIDINSTLNVGSDLTTLFPSPNLAPVAAKIGCPMLDGSLDAYIPLWDEPAGTGLGATGTERASTLTYFEGAEGAQESMRPTVFHDLWATMTMGWAEQDGSGIGIE